MASVIIVLKKCGFTGFLGGEVVCRKCQLSDTEFLFKRNHFYDALTIQVYWRLHKEIEPRYYDLWKAR